MVHYILIDISLVSFFSLFHIARFQSGIYDFKEALRLCPDFPDAEVALKTSQEDLERSQHVPPSQHL